MTFNMNTYQESVIISDIIVERASNNQVEQSCSSLTNNYYSQLAFANTPYSFDWGAGGGTSGQVKISVGSAVFMVEYDAVNEAVVVFGECGTTVWEHLSVADDIVLQYANGGLTFDVQFELHDGTDLKIVVETGSNTTIAAFD